MVFGLADKDDYMKQAKKLTRDQKEIVRSQGLNENEWMFVKSSEFYMTIINKENGKTKIIDNFRRKNNGR